MARKSNKTAHVLNLLAGHDAAKDPDGQTSAEQKTSGGTAAQTAPGGAEEQAAQTVPDEAAGQAAQTVPDETTGQAAQTVPNGTTGQAVSADAGTVSGNAGQPAAAASANTHIPSPAVPPQNNIAVIDKTEDDPVAELIQQKLSSEFEKQIQQSQPEASAPAETTSAPEVVSAEVSSGNSDSMSAADTKVNPVADTNPETASSSDSGISSAPDTVPVPMSSANAVDVSETPASDPAPDQIAAAASPTNASVPEPAPTPQTDAAQNDLNTPAAAAQPDSEPIASSEEPTAVPETVSEQEPQANSDPELQPASEPDPELQPVPEPDPEPDYAAVNVMEHIVNEKIIYFMRQFDVCTCDRCKADVIALTLNGLIPKYIVTMKAAVDPLLSYYTNRLISDVTVEATKACMIVKENPRH